MRIEPPDTRRRKRGSRTGPASGVPSTHPGPGFEAPPPSRTVSPEAIERPPEQVPGGGFAVPPPQQLAEPPAGVRTLEPPAPEILEAARRHPFLTLRRRAVPGTRRHGLAAGQVLVAMVVCFGLWTLLSAHALKKAAEASPVGKRRTAALAVLRPLDALSRVLFLDRLSGELQRAVGHDPDRTSPGGGVLADGPQPPPEQPQPGGGGGPTPGTHHHGTTGHGVHKGHGTGSGVPEPRPGHHGGGQAGGPGTKVGPLRVPTAARPLRVLVVGDSFAEDIELGLGRAFDPDTVRIFEQGIHSTGLSRPDYYNWPQALQVQMQKHHPDLVVVMLGGNDPQALRTVSGEVVPFGVGDPRWPRIYRSRVDRFMEIASEHGAHVAWVGLPIMGSAAYSRNIRAVDDFYQREARTHRSVLYLDTWKLFSDANGHYTAYLPDRHGNLLLMRDGDEIHLTSAGNDRLALALIRAMRSRWQLAASALR